MITKQFFLICHLLTIAIFRREVTSRDKWQRKKAAYSMRVTTGFGVYVLCVTTEIQWLV